MKSKIIKILAHFFLLERKTKQWLLITADILTICFLFIFSIFVRLENFSFLSNKETFIGLTVALTTGIAVFWVRGLYSALTRYVSSDTVVTVILAGVFTLLSLLAVNNLINLNIPRSALLLFTYQLCLATISLRFLIRSLAKSVMIKDKENIAIYGVDRTGAQIAEALRGDQNYSVKLLIDDRKDFSGKTVGGIPVHSLEKAKTILAKHEITTLLIAASGINETVKEGILEALTLHPLKIKTVPSFKSLLDNRNEIGNFTDIKIEELLGREPILPDKELIQEAIPGKVILVTGAGGSIGGELCRQILPHKPKTLILLDISEFSIYTLLDEFNSGGYATETEIIPLVGSVTDKIFITKLFEKFSINTVYHAAAYKHVPLMEINVMQCIANNVLGTLTVAKIASSRNVGSFILVSTDKAVNPTNFMGASKRIAEIACLGLATEKLETCFSIVRFGNVLGSSGSVVPLFRKQIAKGGPITVTSENITRYFMTISEASQLVIQAGSISLSGEIYVLDMGTPIKIVDLARKMILLSGLKPAAVPIKITGLRPGEKLHEELAYQGALISTAHPRIMESKEKVDERIDWKELINKIEATVASSNDRALIEIVQSITKDVSDAESSSNAFFRKNERNPDSINL